MFQGSPSDVERNRTPLAYDPASLASLILLDSAKIRTEQARKGSRRPKRRAQGAMSVGAVSGATSDDDAETRLRSQPPAVATREIEPLYDLDDASAAIARFQPVSYGRPVDVAPGITATFRDAGHILGSAIIVLDVDDSGRSRRLVFSGDLGRPGTPIIDDPAASVPRSRRPRSV